MSPVDTIPVWWDWMAPTAVRLAAVGGGAWLLDVITGHRLWPSCRAASWTAVVVVACLPPTLGSPLGVAQLGVPAVPADGPAPGLPLVALVWLAGAAAVASLVTARARRLRRGLLDGARPCGPGLLRRADRAAARLGLRRRFDLRLAAHAPGPVVAGFLRPVVVLPASFARAGDEVVDHVLLHEFAHLRRRDPLRELGLLAVQVVFWFHPAIAVARRRLRLLREIACDRMVARTLGGDARSYRNTLLELARPMLHRPVAGVTFLTPRSQIVARLQQLERLPARPGLRRAAGVLTFAVLLCCAPFARPSPSPVALDELQGCLQLRFAVMKAMAEADAPDR